MSEFVGATAAGLVGDKDEWTDVDDQEEESGAVEGFEEWGAMALPKTRLPNGLTETQETAAATGSIMSQQLGASEGNTGQGTTGEFHEHSKNPSMGESWSWGAAWSAFATAVQQDVKEIAGSVKKSVTTLRDEFQHEEKPAMLPGEVPEQDEKELSDGSDKELDAGLGAIDQQVDQIASAAGKALGSLWTGIGGAISSTAQAASSVAGQLEQAAMQAAGTNGRRDGTQEDEWQVLDLLGSPATSVAASFDQLFKLYRGHRFSEELEALGNEAARSCNRVRTQLPELQRSELDSIVAMTAAAVDLLATVAPTQDAHSAARALIHDIPSSARNLEKGELPVAQRGGPREGLASMCAAAVDRAVHMRDSLSTESPQKAWEGLCRVRAEGLKLLAEFTALSIQHMAFLAMCLEGGDAEAAGLQFLPDGSNKGAVVRDVLLQLLSDTDAIFEAFYTALEQATEDDEFAAMLLDQPADDGADLAAEELGIPQQQSSLSEISGGSQRDASLQPNMALVVGELKGGLLVGVKAAVDRIMQGSRNLIYPICAPAAVRLDAETGLSPVGNIGQQPYEHVPNPENSGDPDAEGSGLMGRHRTTSLSNPLFESVGAVPSHMASHESMSGVDTVVEASDSQLTPTADAPFPEASSPLTGGTPGNEEGATHPALAEEEDSLTQVQPPCLGSDSSAYAKEQTTGQQAAPVQEEKGASDAVGEVEEASPEAVEQPEAEQISSSETTATAAQGNKEDNIENSAPENVAVEEAGIQEDAAQCKAGDEESLVAGNAGEESEPVDEGAVPLETEQSTVARSPAPADDTSLPSLNSATAEAPDDAVKEESSPAEAAAQSEETGASSPKAQAEVREGKAAGEEAAQDPGTEPAAAESIQ